MPVTNILANLFISLQNSEMRHKKECIIIPASNLASEVMRVLQKRRYIGEFEFIDDGVTGKLRVQLLGRINKCGAVSPRFPIKAKEFQKWESREKLSRVVTLDEVRKADFNLSPSLFVDTNEATSHRPLKTIIADLTAAAAERDL